jgi:4-amino-4-deoxy-L-arabinose transferase-like glycosyltransferase
LEVAREPTRASIRGIEALARAWDRLRVNWQIVFVLFLFAGTTFVVPTLTPVATTDDWGYSRSVEILVREGRLTVFPVVAATAVFQIFWGSFFAELFGMTLGVMRVATLTMVLFGAIALYALLRELGVDRHRSALGVAIYLFNPLMFALSYTFMTDPYLTSLSVIATYCYVRGLRPSGVSGRIIVAGSVVAACAFLTRQQGALIPLAVISHLVVTGRLRPNRAGLALLLRVSAIPFVSIVLYYIWLKSFNDVPAVQTGFFDEARTAGLPGTWRLIRHLSLIEMMYLGFFVTPVAISLIPSLRRLFRDLRAVGGTLLCIWAATFSVGLTRYWIDGRRMPYVPQFVGAGGLGPSDVVGSRPRIFDGQFFDGATVVCAICAVVFALVLCRSIRSVSSNRSTVGLVLAIALWQVAGILPPSYHYLSRGYSLDRYLLPLLPLGVSLLLWGARDLRLFKPIAWLIVAIFAVFSIAATRDYLVFMNTVWKTASEANAAGVANEHLDAGSAWDGYFLYTYGLDHGISRARTRGGPWWTYFYGKATDSNYVVAGKPRPGYAIVRVRPYSPWLQGEPDSIYLLRRYGLPSSP